jgi:hypothetical protein
MKLLKTLTACMSHESQGKSTPKNSTKSPQNKLHVLLQMHPTNWFESPYGFQHSNIKNSDIVEG